MVLAVVVPVLIGADVVEGDAVAAEVVDRATDVVVGRRVVVDAAWVDDDEHAAAAIAMMPAAEIERILVCIMTGTLRRPRHRPGPRRSSLAA